ncbi:MAG: LysM peptidoglycan-binding domain-containing protein [Chloroflexota bacterium]
MRLSLLVNVLVVFAVATTLIGAGLMFGLLAVPGGTAVATTRPPTSVPSVTPSAVPSASPTVAPSGLPTVRPSPGGTYVVQAGDTLSTIGELYGVSYLLIAEANGIPSPYIIHEGDVLIIPIPETACGDYEAYVVQSGDFIISIADGLSVDASELADFNNLVDWNSIRPGDILCVPQPGWTPLPTTSAAAE